MSPRRKISRKMPEPPVTIGFYPIGVQSGEKRSIQLFYEEYEAVRLSDYCGLSHEEAAVLMTVSRPTFSRIYESARRKIATALIHNCPLIINGGRVQFEGDWFRCRNCERIFEIPQRGSNVEKCPVCHESNPDHLNVKGLDQAYTKKRKDLSNTMYEGSVGFCICPECGIKLSHIPGLPCRQEICPECKVYMVRDSRKPDTLLFE